MWFHGGVPGLRPGQLVLPPTKSGTTASTHYGKDARHVFITREIGFALYMARTSTIRSHVPWSTASVYEVEPLGELHPDIHEAGDRRGFRMFLQARVLAGVDDDNYPPLAFAVDEGMTASVESARVVRVVASNLKMRASDHATMTEMARMLSAQTGERFVYDGTEALDVDPAFDEYHRERVRNESARSSAG